VALRSAAPDAVGANWHFPRISRTDSEQNTPTEYIQSVACRVECEGTSYD